MEPIYRASEEAVAKANQLRAESDRIRAALKVETNRARMLIIDVSNLLRHVKKTDKEREAHG